MAVLTVKLSTEQRDALVAIVQARIHTCNAGADDADTGTAQRAYVEERITLHAALRELTTRARDYVNETAAR